jgi:SAM-dependent methyltransferase
MNKTEGQLKAHDFFNQAEQIAEYDRIYGNLSFEKEYPANRKRLEIFLAILEKIKPKSLVDAGCGNGMPLVAMLTQGLNCSGYDKSTNMIAEARANLKRYGFEENKVMLGDFENPEHLNEESVECITGMGTFYYANDVLGTIKNQVRTLKSGGHLIFSLRNKLFDLVTLNKYTAKFLRELYSTDLNSEAVDAIDKLLTRVSDTPINRNSIDSMGVASGVHNPLTISTELLQPAGLELKGLYFYHFHAMPPSLEMRFTQEFRRASWTMENPTDWRGNFLASSFIIHAIKKH